MASIDFAATAATMVTDLTAAGGPIKAAITVGILLLTVSVGWKVFRRFVK